MVLTTAYCSGTVYCLLTRVVALPTVVALITSYHHVTAYCYGTVYCRGTAYSGDTVYCLMQRHCLLSLNCLLPTVVALLLQTHLNLTTITLNPTSMFQSQGLLPYTGLLGTLLTLTAHHLLLNFPVFQSFHLLKMQTSSVTFCAL